MFRITLLATGLLISTSAYGAEIGAIRASCTQNGKIVYREDLPLGTSANRRLEIASANPNATCVFLKDDPAINSLDAGGSVDEAQVPEPVAIGDIKAEPSGDLATALSYLSQGETLGRPYGEKFNKSMEEFLKNDGPFNDESGKKENTVNLTIAVYKNASADDITQHWAFIQKNTRKLGKFPPTVQTVGDVTVLNVENVSDHDAAEVCEEAERVASGCMAVY